MRRLLLTLAMLPAFASFSQLIHPQLVSTKTQLVGTTGPRVVFYGMTSLNSSSEDLIDNISASGRLAVQIVPFENRRLSINIAANLLNTGSRTEKKDSVDFNALMFPETGNFGFMFNPSFQLLTSAGSEHQLLLDGTYSYRKINLDSPAVGFKINSVNIGLKYVWTYVNPADDEEIVTFTLMPYWNLFNVPDEDVKRFNNIMNDPLFMDVNKTAEIYSIGLKSTVQFKSFIFFADLRRNVKTKELDDDNPFKGTKFNIGFATSFRLKSF